MGKKLKVFYTIQNQKKKNDFFLQVLEYAHVDVLLSLDGSFLTILFF